MSLTADVEAVKLPGPSRRVRAITTGFKSIDSVGMYMLALARMEREYINNGKLHQLGRRILGEGGWTDAFITCEDILDPERRRHFLVREAQKEVLVVVGDFHKPDKAIVRSPDTSDVAMLNQVLAYATYMEVEQQQSSTLDI